MVAEEERIRCSECKRYLKYNITSVAENKRRNGLLKCLRCNCNLSKEESEKIVNSVLLTPFPKLIKSPR